MSRHYEMTFRVSGIPKGRVEEVALVIEEVWEVEPITDISPGDLTLYGQDHLYGGITEEQFAEKMAARIWRAAGQYVPVEIVATCLEDIPNESYVFNELDYDQWKDEEERDGN